MPRWMDVSAVLHNHESDQVGQRGLADSVEDLPVDIIIPVSQLKVLRLLCIHNGLFTGGQSRPFKS
jgi:hypothetical protein